MFDTRTGERLRVERVLAIATGGLRALRVTGGSSGRDCVEAPVTRAQPTADGIRFGFTGREDLWTLSQRQFERFVTWAEVRGSGGAASSDFRMRP